MVAAVNWCTWAYFCLYNISLVSRYLTLDGPCNIPDLDSLFRLCQDGLPPAASVHSHARTQMYTNMLLHCTHTHTNTQHTQTLTCTNTQTYYTHTHTHINVYCILISDENMSQECTHGIQALCTLHT